MAQVVETIQSAPEKFLATVRPITAVQKGHRPDLGKIIYSEIVPMATAASSTTEGGGKRLMISNGSNAPPVSATPPHQAISLCSLSLTGP